MGYDINAPIKYTAVNRCCKSVVNNERNAVFVSNFGKSLDIKNIKARIEIVSPKTAFVFGLNAA